MIIDHETLHSFCSTIPTRAELATPWTARGKTYASDGATIIEVPDTGMQYSNLGPKVKPWQILNKAHQ